VKILTDNPVQTANDDEFGFEQFANIISTTIQETERLPFCIGIFAEWGAGKSSLMNLVKDNLSFKGGIETIWFNPWKYDKKEDLWNALIQTVLYGIINKSKDEDVKNKAKRLAKSTLWLAIKKGVSRATAGIVAEDDLDSLIQNFSEHDELYYQHINNFEENFCHVVKSYTNNGKLVIFVDDLDRCLPENAITVLESLKLFIGNSNCIFVLGMDHLVVEQGLEARFSEKIKLSGRDYLDKIIQVPFYLPAIPFNTLKKAYIQNGIEDFCDKIWKVVEYGLGGNPRKTKRFVNSSSIANAIIKSRNETTVLSDVELISAEKQKYFIAKLLIFQMEFLDFYNFIKSNHSAWHTFASKIVNAVNEKERNSALEHYKNLEFFWNTNEKLKMFMIQTETPEFYPPPTAKQLSPMIQAISIASSDR